MSFSEFELDRRLEKGILSLGYQKPTRIQQATIPQALDGLDILASAPTGTGKTAATGHLDKGAQVSNGKIIRHFQLIDRFLSFE